MENYQKLLDELDGKRERSTFDKLLSEYDTTKVIDGMNEVDLENNEDWILLDICPRELLVEAVQVIDSNGTILEKTLLSIVGRTMIGFIMKRWLGYRNAEECIIRGQVYVNTRTGSADIRAPVFAHPNHLTRFRDFDFVLDCVNHFPTEAMGISQLIDLLNYRNPNAGERISLIYAIANHMCFVPYSILSEIGNDMSKNLLRLPSQDLLYLERLLKNHFQGEDWKKRIVCPRFNQILNDTINSYAKGSIDHQKIFDGHLGPMLFIRYAFNHYKDAKNPQIGIHQVPSEDPVFIGKQLFAMVGDHLCQIMRYLFLCVNEFKGLQRESYY